MKFYKTKIHSLIFLFLGICGINMLVVVITTIWRYQTESTHSSASGQTTGLQNKPLIPCSNSSFMSTIKGNRILDVKPCVMAECQTGNLHVEHNNIEICNMMQCNISNCDKEKLCPKTTSSRIITSHTTQDILLEADGQNCTSFSLFSAKKMGIAGGHWVPTKCSPTRRVAIIIPFRDREEHLCILLKNLIPILIAQQTEFRIFVVEQIGNTTFNKGRLMNAGFLEAGKMFDFNCVFFHDVDLIPENDRNLYECGDQPRHLSVAIDEDDYKLMYSWLVGGVLGFRPHIFHRVNGYSNMFWGWGGEDDDMNFRIRHLGLRVMRPPSSVARYTMIRHKKRERWPKRVEVLNTWRKRIKTDGLRNVPYKLISAQIYTYYTKFRVDVGKQEDIVKKDEATFTKQNVSERIS